MADREFMRKLLDDVLGADRNKLPDQSGDFGVKYHDHSVCKYYLVGFCPYMQFQNTKSDMGNCPKRYHEEKIRETFLAEGSEKHREEYEREYMAFLEKLVNDLERKLRKGKDRLDFKPNDPTAALNPINDEFEERRTILDLQIKEVLAKVEQYGEEGRIQEAQEMMQELDRLKSEMERLRQIEAENPAYRLEKKMEVCTTCGAFLIVGDAQKRIEAHFEGRQHNGWALTREALAELKRKYSSSDGRRRPDDVGAQPEPGELDDAGMDRYYPDRDSRDRSRRRSIDERHDNRDRDRDRDRNRGYDRDRDRDYRASRDHDRDRDRSHYNRDRDRDTRLSHNNDRDRRSSRSPTRGRRY